MKTHYILEKMGWNDSLGGYSVAVARRGPLSLAQIRTRIKRLPESTVWLWSASRIETDRHGRQSLVGRISAEEFSGDVPRYS